MNITKRMKKSGTTALTTACLLVTVSATMAAAPATVAGTYGTVVIGDLHGMVDRGAELAKKVSPGISGEVVRGQLGMMLGDEGLKSVPAGSGVVAVMPQSGKAFLLLETAEGKAEAFADLLKQRIGASTKVVSDKLVAVSMGEDALANATGAMGTAAAALLNNNDDKFIVATVDADLLIKDKASQMDAAFAKLPQMTAKSDDGESSSSDKMFKVVGQMVKSIAKRTDVATIKIDISGDGILFEKSLFASGGVTLAKPEGLTGQELLKGISGSDAALTRLESFMDTQSAMAALNGFFSEILQASNSSAQDKETIFNLMKTASEGFGDGSAAAISMDKEGTNGTYIISVANSEKAMQYIDDASKQFSDSGAFGKLYSAMGMETSMTLQKNVGTAEGQPVHQFSVSMTPPAGAAMPMAGMINSKTGKFTIIDNKMVVALGKTSIDDAVAATKAGAAAAGKELSSRAKLPAGGAVYIDYNLGAVAPMLKEDNAEAAKALQGLIGVPILEGIYTDADSLKLVIKVPAEMITKGVDAAKNMVQKQSEMSDDSNDADTSEESKSTTSPDTTE